MDKQGLNKKASKKGGETAASCASLGSAGKAIASQPQTKPAVEIGLLRRIYNLARGSVFTPQQRDELLDDTAKRIRDTSVDVRAFGVKNARDLAEVFVKIFEEMEIKKKTFRAFISFARIKGMQGPVAGKLFELLALNFKPLQEDLIAAAWEQLRELNNIPFGDLLNARGKKLPRQVNFEKVLRATEIRIITQGKREFIDAAYVSLCGEGKDRLWTFLEEIEVKMPASAKEFGEQIGVAQLRLADKEAIQVEMIVEGIGRVEVTPERIVFSPKSVDRNAITLNNSRQWARLTESEQVALTDAFHQGDQDQIYRASGFRMQSTSKGQGEVFRRITIALSVDEVYKVVRAVFPSRTR